MRDPTVFDQIIAGEIPSSKVYETDAVLGIRDINPMAETHILFLTKSEEDYMPSILAISEDSAHIPPKLLQAARDFAKEKGIESFKLMFHCGPAYCEVPDFLHLHFLSDESFEE